MRGFRNRASVKIHHRLAGVNPLVDILAVVTYREHHALRHQIVFNKTHRDRIHHLAHHQARLLEGIRILQHLPLAHTLGSRFCILDVGDGAGLVTPGMIDQQFRIHAEHLVERLGILDAYPRNIAHRADAAAAVQITFLQASRDAPAHLPEARNRLVRPELFAVSHFVEFRDAHAVFVGLHMLRHHVHRNLAQVKVRADPARRGDSRRRKNILDNRLHQLAGGLLIQLQVFRQVQEAFVDGIGMDIVGTHILEVDIVDLRGILHVLRHLRFRNQELDLLARTPLHLANLLIHFEKAGAPRNPVGLEGGRHREANRLLGAALVGHYELCLERVQTTEDTFHRGKERLEVNGCVSTRLHT